MAVLSLSEVPALKKLANEYGYEIHLHDACGGQAFEIEEIENHENKEDKKEEFYQKLEDFFSEHSMKIQFFGEKKRSFSAK